GNPIRQRVQTLLPRQVADRHQGLCTVVVGLPDKVPKAFLAHDVEDRHVHVDLHIRSVGHHEFDLADPSPDRTQVGVFVLVHDEPSHRGGLPDPPPPQHHALRLPPLTLTPPSPPAPPT